MEFVEIPGFGERFTFPGNVEITINGDTMSTVRQAAVRMAERWEEAVVCEIVKEARVAGYTEVTVLNKEAILEALRRYLTAPKTNADRIRAMSDEELADFFFESPEIEFTVCEYCEYFGGHTSNTPCKHDMGRCLVPAKNEAFKKWLQQPAKEVSADG